MNKETIELVKKMVEDGNLPQEVAIKYCPELAESEDEKIRKEIIKIVNDHYSLFKEIDRAKAIAWLEKQSEKHLENYDEAEKEKADFVGDGFIKCYANFQDFKEGETYWLEYVGNDDYNVRSDNLLGKTYHITPCQLYTIFKKQTWLEKQSEQNEWSEEDENRFNNLIFLVECSNENEPTKKGFINFINRLKSLRPQKNN